MDYKHEKFVFTDFFYLVTVFKMYAKMVVASFDSINAKFC